MGIRPLQVVAPRIYESPTAHLLEGIRARIPLSPDPKLDLKLIAKHAPKPANTPLQLFRPPPELPTNGPGRIGLPGILGAGAAVVGALEGAYQVYEGWRVQQENEAAAQEVWRFAQIGIRRIAQTVEQVFSELKELETLRRRSADLQFQIHQLKQLPGYDAVVFRLTQELETLQVQMSTAAKVYPLIGGALMMTASGAFATSDHIETAPLLRKDELLQQLQSDPHRCIAGIKHRAILYKAELLRRLDRGESLESINDWFKATVLQDLQVVSDVQMERARGLGIEFATALHDARRHFGYFNNIRLALMYGEVERVRKFCRSGFRTMADMLEYIVAIFKNRARIEIAVNTHDLRTVDVDALRNLQFHSLEQAEVLLRILENLVQNSIEHRPPTVTFDFEHVIWVNVHTDGSRDILVYDENGINPVAIQSIFHGMRTHNGEVLTDGGDESPDTQGHGYGWLSIGGLADTYGIAWSINGANPPGRKLVSPEAQRAQDLWLQHSGVDAEFVRRWGPSACSWASFDRGFCVVHLSLSDNFFSPP